MLGGFHELDEHFKNAPFEKNLPFCSACFGIWYDNFFGAQSHAVLPYDQYLSRFPAYLQQLDMRGNRQERHARRRAVSYQTGPIIWGSRVPTVSTPFIN